MQQECPGGTASLDFFEWILLSRGFAFIKIKGQRQPMQPPQTWLLSAEATFLYTTTLFLAVS